MPSAYSTKTPVGTVIAFAGTTAPSGWLLCDGTAVSRTTYAALFAVVTATHGQGDGSTTFNVPDYRGRFLRGVDGAANRDPDKAGRTNMNTGGNVGNNVGSIQGAAIASHAHSFSYLPMSGTGPGGGSYATGSGATQATDAVGGNETRPINAYVNYIIKY